MIFIFTEMEGGRKLLTSKDLLVEQIDSFMHGQEFFNSYYAEIENNPEHSIEVYVPEPEEPIE